MLRHMSYVYLWIYLTRQGNTSTIEAIFFYGADVVEWSRALVIRLNDWCCSVSMVSVRIPSREEHKFESSEI